MSSPNVNSPGSRRVRQARRIYNGTQNRLSHSNPPIAEAVPANMIKVTFYDLDGHTVSGLLPRHPSLIKTFSNCNNPEEIFLQVSKAEHSWKIAEHIAYDKEAE